MADQVKAGLLLVLILASLVAGAVYAWDAELDHPYERPNIERRLKVLRGEL